MQAALANKQIAGASGLPPDSFCAHHLSGFPSEQLCWPPGGCRCRCRCRRSSKILCASIPIVPKKKNNLLAEAEQRWLRAVESPLQGLSFSEDEFAALLPKYDYTIGVGDMVQGTVFLADKNGALIDIGGKAPAFLPIDEASLIAIKSLDEIGVVPRVQKEFYILREDYSNARMILSLKKIELDLAWERCRELQEVDAVVSSSVLDVNRGGLIVTIEGIRGFVPLSHLPEKNNFEEYKGKVIPLKFIEVAQKTNKLVLSHRLALSEYQASSLSIGQVVEGVVSNLKSYGAFISVGGAIGLIHISEISHARVTDVQSVFQPGDKLKALVVNLDLKKGQISLSTKKLEPSMGDMLRNPQLVFDSAEEMAHKFTQRRIQREALTIEGECSFNQEEKASS